MKNSKKEAAGGPISYAAIGADKVIRENLSRLQQLYRAERVVRDLPRTDDRPIDMGRDWEEARMELSERVNHAREAYQQATGEEWS